MPNILIIYFSETGNTKKMAELIGSGAKKENVNVKAESVENISAEDLLKYDGIIIGSPTYYGTMAAPIKKLLDESVKFHGELDGRVGGAFSSSANIGGGNETTIMDILHAMLIHGMVIQGDHDGDHYGPVSIGMPDARAAKGCIRYGQRIAKLVKKLKT